MTTPPPTLFDRFNAWLRASVTLKLLIVGFLLLILLIPTSMVKDLIRERAEYRDGAQAEVSDKWGGPQLLTGPVLVVPYRATERDEKGNVLTSRAYACFLPDSLRLAGELLPEHRQRGLYDLLVYRAKVRVSGFFQTEALTNWNISPADVYWNEAFVATGLADLKGLRQAVTLNWDSQAQAFEPGVPGNVLPHGSAPNAGALSDDVFQAEHYASKRLSIEAAGGPAGTSGFHASVPIPDAAALGARHTFSYDLDVNGSTGLLMAPLGRTTAVHLTSPWASPSFIGDFLPRERTVGPSGFQADWTVLHLNREYPQRWRTAEQPGISVDGSTFGVRLLVPVDEYQQSMRAAKYALLPLALTFLVFFFVEVLQRRRVHPMQYLLVGFALVIFYLLLLALGEYVRFATAYWLAAAAVVGLIGAYVTAIFRRPRLTAIVVGVLALIYGFVFTVLRLEDYALLIGSLGLLLILALVMWVSRRIDWYSAGTPTSVITEAASDLE